MSPAKSSETKRPDEAPVKVKTITPVRRELVLTDFDGMDWTFHLEANAKIWINGHEGTLTALKKGEEVKVTFAFCSQGRPIAREIRCQRQPRGK